MSKNRFIVFFKCIINLFFSYYLLRLIIWYCTGIYSDPNYPVWAAIVAFTATIFLALSLYFAYGLFYVGSIISFLIHAKIVDSQGNQITQLGSFIFFILQLVVIILAILIQIFLKLKNGKADV